MSASEKTATLWPDTFAVLLWLCLSLVLRFWVLYTVPWPRPWLEATVRWLGNSSLVLVGVAAVVCAASWLVYLWRERRERFAARQEEAENANLDRRGTREALRAWSLRLEHEYSWVLKMPGLMQQERALQWYVEITKSWREENRAFEQIAAKDDYRLAAAELGPLIPRMLRIWAGRTAVYQYAIAWSDPVERQDELFRVQRKVQQLKVREVDEQRKFAETLKPPPASLSNTTPDIEWVKPPKFVPKSSPRPKSRKAVAS